MLTGTGGTAGFGLIELVAALPLAAVAVVLVVSTWTTALQHRQTQRERARASYAARAVLERMIAVEAEEVWALYNEDPFDDPNGPGTAPGKHFAVPGLQVAPGDADGFVGEVLLPAVNVGTAAAPVWVLREDQVLPELGMPRDLDGDHIVDAADHALDYRLLPVQVRVEWQGVLGPARLTMTSSLADYVRP